MPIYQFASGAVAALSAAPSRFLSALAAQVLIGTAGADQLRDVAGGAALQGGAGDDSYYVGDYRTTVAEGAGAGLDTVSTFVTFTLPANVENMFVLRGGATGTGNDGANLIVAEAGGTTINGGRGDDILVDDSTGTTTFLFQTGSGRDVVYGFNPTGAGHDLLKIDHDGISNWLQLKNKLSQVGSDVVITFNTKDSVVLKDVSLGSLTQDDFNIVANNVGVYIGNFKSGLPAYENWLGRRADYVWANVDTRSWALELQGLEWQLSQENGTLPQTIVWTIPMLVQGANYTAAAQGAYNGQYLALAQMLKKWVGTEKEIIIRPANEFNGNWFLYSVPAGQEATFVQAWKNYVDVFRSVGINVKFEWNISIGADYGVNLAAAYPGDSYVDYIGGDFYYIAKYYGQDPIKAWNTLLNHKAGLQWLENFAAAHGKQTAYSEWGVDTNNAGPYIAKVAEWFATHDVAYQIYWNSNADPAAVTRLDNNQYPAASAAYIAAFGPGPSTPVDTAYHFDSLYLADSYFSVATLNYQFFTGAIPSKEGMDYLVSGVGGNANSLESGYYQSFNLENRYINFAVNLGKYGAGHESFEKNFGTKSLLETAAAAYTTIFGSAPSEEKVHALVDPRVDYFALYGGDGANGIGTKAALVGWLLAEAVRSKLGVYAKANDAFLADLSDGNGASYSVDLIGVYGRPEYVYTGA
jgi:hypothetical protein